MTIIVLNIYSVVFFLYFDGIYSSSSVPTDVQRKENNNNKSILQMNCNLSEDMILPINIEEISSFDQPTHEITITSSASISLPGTSCNNRFLLFSAHRKVFHDR